MVRQLSWSRFLQVSPIENELKREFYHTMAADQRWSKRTPKAKIDSMLYERTAVAKHPDEVIRHDLELLHNERKMSADLAVHDAYFLDFLGKENDFSEKGHYKSSKLRGTKSGCEIKFCVSARFC